MGPLMKNNTQDKNFTILQKATKEHVVYIVQLHDPKQIIFELKPYTLYGYSIVKSIVQDLGYKITKSEYDQPYFVFNII
jgi:hypothetical protein